MTNVDWVLIHRLDINGISSEVFPVELVFGEEYLDYAVLKIKNTKVFPEWLTLKDENEEMKSPEVESQVMRTTFYRAMLSFTADRPVLLPERQTSELRQVYPFVTKAGRITSKTGLNRFRGGLIELGSGNWRGASGAPVVDALYHLVAIHSGSYYESGEMSDSFDMQRVNIKSCSESSASVTHARMIYNVKKLREFLRRN